MHDRPGFMIDVVKRWISFKTVNGTGACTTISSALTIPLRKFSCFNTVNGRGACTTGETCKRKAERLRLFQNRKR